MKNGRQRISCHHEIAWFRRSSHGRVNIWNRLSIAMAWSQANLSQYTPPTRRGTQKNWHTTPNIRFVTTPYKFPRSLNMYSYNIPTPWTNAQSKRETILNIKRRLKKSAVCLIWEYSTPCAARIKRRSRIGTLYPRSRVNSPHNICMLMINITGQ